MELEKESKDYDEYNKKIESEIERASKMLSNPGFVNKAPEAKINEEKAKLAKYQEMLKTPLHFTANEPKSSIQLNRLPTLLLKEVRPLEKIKGFFRGLANLFKNMSDIVEYSETQRKTENALTAINESLQSINTNMDSMKMKLDQVSAQNAQLDEDMKKSNAYTYIHAQNAGMDTMFSISSQGKSAKSMVDELLYKHSYCIQTATINIITIYY